MGKAAFITLGRWIIALLAAVLEGIGLSCTCLSAARRVSIIESAAAVAIDATSVCMINGHAGTEPSPCLSAARRLGPI